MNRAPGTPPPKNAPFGSTPSPATVDRLLLPRLETRQESSELNHDNQSTTTTTATNAVNKKHSRKRTNSIKSTTSNHSNKSNRSAVSVVYAVDANIRRPSSPVVNSPKHGHHHRTNSNNNVATHSTDGKIGAEASSRPVAEANNNNNIKNKKKKKFRVAETQTKLSYCGDYEHGRPVLVHREDPDVYVGKTVASLLMLGIVMDLMMGSVSYFINWRIRDPLLLARGNQAFLSQVYPVALVSGLGVATGVSLPVLSWVVSGYLDAKKLDKYFLFAQIMWTVFSGFPMVLVEAMFVGPLSRTEVVYYEPEKLMLSQLALVLHCLVAGASLWYFYLIFCSRKLNEAVEGRRELLIQYQRGIAGGRKCEASRIAIRTVAEIEESQQSCELYSINDIITNKAAASRRNDGSGVVDFANRFQAGVDNSISQTASASNDTGNNKNDIGGVGGDGFSASPLPIQTEGIHGHQRRKNHHRFSIGGKKFSAVTSSETGREAATELGEENGWGTPFKEVVEKAVDDEKKKKKKKDNDDDNDEEQEDTQDKKNSSSNGSIVEVPASPKSTTTTATALNRSMVPNASAATNDEMNNENNNNRNANKKPSGRKNARSRGNSDANNQQNTDRNSPHVNWKSDGEDYKKDDDDDDDDEERLAKMSVARNMFDDDDPFRR